MRVLIASPPLCVVVCTFLFLDVCCIVSSSSPVYLGYILIILVYPGSRSKSLKFILDIFTWALSIHELRGRERAKHLLTSAYM
jgi:hypothetical protein